MVATKNLHAAQLVATIRDAAGTVADEYVHLFELANDGGAKVSDAGTDPWNHSVVVVQRFTSVVKIGLAGLQINRALQCVDDRWIVTARLGGVHQTSSAVATGSRGEDSEFHVVKLE